ncbi:MAG TPA: S28 family serine protease [Kofleriaceae bacterium]
MVARWVAIAVLAAACGDNLGVPTAVDTTAELLGELRALPNVAGAMQLPTDDRDYTYIVLQFRQPVDHADPGGAQFLQEVSLLHRNFSAPLVVWTSGYWDYYLDHITEPTDLLDANQISIEHRFFGSSVPDPADWSKLTIEQMAADEHAIVTALRTIYPGPAIASGASKGGMTAIYYRRFYPDDVVATVPYVAPVMFGNPDERFPPFIATLGPADCHAAVRALAVELLSHHRAAIEQRAQAQAGANGYAYTRVALGPAVESAIEGLEWSFWQYHGLTDCPHVPAVDASDDDLFDFLDSVSPISASDDDQVAAFDPWVYQADFQLGYPDDGTDYLQPYYMYGAADFAGVLPQGVAPPVYDGGVAMADIDGFVEEQAARLLFVYGEWDPWTGGAFDLAGTRDSLKLIEAAGDHDSNLLGLARADEQAAFAKLAAWTGVSPSGTARVARPRLHAPHLPAGIARALRARDTRQP